MIQGINAVLFYTSFILLTFTTFSTYAGLGNTVTPRKVFTAITLFSFIRLYCVQFFVLAFLGLSELLVAIKRIEVSKETDLQMSNGFNVCIQKLLLLPELSGTAIIGTNSDPVSATNRSCELINDDGHELLPNSGAPRVIVDDLMASWTYVRKQ